MASGYAALKHELASAANSVAYAYRDTGGGSDDAAPLVLLAGLIPQARVKIYRDAAHGFLFQHHAEFAADVDDFLTAGSS